MLLFAIFAGIYFYFPKMSGKMIPDWIGQVHFWGMFIGAEHHVLPAAFSWAVRACHRRYIDYPDAFATWNYVSSLGAFLSFCIVPVL